jgi:hypothetical protein
MTGTFGVISIILGAAGIIIGVLNLQLKPFLLGIGFAWLGSWLVKQE